MNRRSNRNLLRPFRHYVRYWLGDHSDHEPCTATHPETGVRCYLQPDPYGRHFGEDTNWCDFLDR
jgi:hypothetical protein